MKTLAIFLIHLYQILFSPVLKNILGVSNMCRHTPSCSSYARHAIEKHGILQGARMSFFRILSCQPFVKIAV